MRSTNHTLGAAWTAICSVFLLCFVAALSGCGGGKGDDGDDGNGASGKPSDDPEFVTVGTAKVGGTFYQVGAGIAAVLDESSEEGGWRKSTAEATAGSLENLRRLESNEIQIGMANSTITYFAVNGKGGFDKQYKVKSVMTLFPLVAMFVTRADSGVETIADLKGKRVVLGPEGAGFDYFVRPILEEHGVKVDELDADYAGMFDSVGYLSDRSVSATFLGGGLTNAPAIVRASTEMDILLVPYDAAARDSLANEYPSFEKVTVPAGSYKGQDEPFAGLNVGSAHLIVRADADEDLVYKMTKIIYENRDKVAERHPAAKAINAKNAVRHTGVDFHPGAVKYYREIRIWPKDDAADSSEAGGG